MYTGCIFIRHSPQTPTERTRGRNSGHCDALSFDMQQETEYVWLNRQT